MDTNLPKKIWIVSKYTLLIMLIQGVSNIVLLAHKSPAQGIDEVYVSVDWQNVDLKYALKVLESKTDYEFFFKDSNVAQIKNISISADRESLKEVLIKLSRQKNLRFKRLNNVISVIKKTREEKALVIEEYDEKEISGRVTDENNDGLPGVNVLVKGTTIGTVTDTDGYYQITVPDETLALTFSSVSYETIEIVLNGRSVINVSLYPDVRALQEVIVVGYGTQEKREVAGSISSVDFEIIENTPIQSFDKVIQGRSPGVQIVNSGAPGGATQVRIRGIGSINSGNQPLYIVDGIQVVEGQYSEIGAQENILASLNPNDIVSIDILKDASASIYGAQAANGVVIITTKRGEKGATQFNFNSHWGISEVISRLDLLNGSEWTELVLEGYANRYGIESNEYQNQLAFLGNPENAPNYDWQELLFQKGFIQNYQLSAKGGDEKNRFFISGSYNNTEGHVIGTGFQRGTLRLNLDNDLSEKVKTSLSTNLSMTNTDATQGDGFWFNNPTTASAFIVPTNAPYNEDGSVREPLFGLFDENPLVNKHPELFDETSTTYKMLTSFSLEYKILEGLVFKSNWGLDFLSNNYKYFGSPNAKVAASVGGTVYESNNRSLNWQTDQTLSFGKVFNELHKIDVLIGANYRQQKLNYFFANGENLSSPKLTAIGTTVTPEIGGNASEWRLAGLFGRINYVFNDKYIFSGTLRRDGSSRFGEENRWGVFPAASVAWRVSSEGFMAGVDNILNDLKIRGSFGITGNANINNFQARGFFTGGNTYLGNGALTPETNSNPNLSWEQSETYNIGLDAAFMDSRIEIVADFFQRNTNDLLLERPVPSTSGYSSVLQNVGKVENKGFELSLNTVNLDLNGFKWTTNFNLTKVKNEIKSLTGETNQIINGAVINRVGKSITSWYAIRWAGVNPADGRPMYYDSDGELIFNPTDDDRVIIAGSLPTYYGGFSNEFIYKGFSLSALFQYSGGNYLRNQLAFSTKASGGFADRNQQRSELNRWQNPGDITDVPIAMNGFDYNARAGNAFSSRHIEKGDYIRLKQLNLSYSFSSPLLDKMKLRSLMLYASGNNLWTKTPYSGRDPEILGGDETGDYPQAKTYVFGINLGF